MIGAVLRWIAGLLIGFGLTLAAIAVTAARRPSESDQRLGTISAEEYCQRRFGRDASVIEASAGGWSCVALPGRDVVEHRLDPTAACVMMFGAGATAHVGEDAPLTWSCFAD